MECNCLTREKYKDFINHTLYNKKLECIDLEYYIERARDYFDCNIVGSNFYLSIIVEQLMKNEELDNNILSEIYGLQESLYFTIEEHGFDFINNLFENNIPSVCNDYRQDLVSAIKKNDDEKIRYLKSISGDPFEQDLNRIMKSYYEE